MTYSYSLILKLHILTFIRLFPLLVTKWLQKLFPTSQKVEIWQPFCLCKLDGQNPNISFGNRVYWIQRTRIMIKSLVPSFYTKMPLGSFSEMAPVYYATSILSAQAWKKSTNTFSIVDWIRQITWFDCLCSMLEYWFYGTYHNHRVI